MIVNNQGSCLVYVVEANCEMFTWAETQRVGLIGYTLAYRSCWDHRNVKSITDASVVQNVGKWQ